MSTAPDGGASAGTPLPPATRIVCTVTDEELVALTDEDGSLVLLPQLMNEPAPRRTAMIQAASRSLGARGLLQPRASGVSVLSRVLAVRQAAPVVLALHRQLGPERGQPEVGASILNRYLHLVEGCVVVEDVTPAGLHTLAVADRGDLGRVLAEFVLPPGGERAGDAPVHLSPDSPAQRTLRLLGSPTLLGEVALVHGGLASERHGGRWLLALGPAGGFFGAMDADGGATLRPTAGCDLIQQLVEQVREAEEAVQALQATMEA